MDSSDRHHPPGQVAEAEEEKAPDGRRGQPDGPVEQGRAAGAQDEDGQVDLPVGLARRDAQREQRDGPDESDHEGEHEVGDPPAGTWRDRAGGTGVAPPGGIGPMNSTPPG